MPLVIFNIDMKNFDMKDFKALLGLNMELKG
jgi:hypothetical protein